MSDETKQLPVGGSPLPALVDAEDFARLARHRWYANRLPDGSLLVCRKATVGKVGRNGRRGHRLLSHDVLDLPAGSRVWHRNGERLDCRRENLRVQGGCIHKVEGPAHARKPHRVMVTVDRRRYHLGYYPRPDMAEWAAREAARVAGELRGKGLAPPKVRRALDRAVGREV